MLASERATRPFDASILSPFRSPRPCKPGRRAKEQRNHNPCVGGSSPSSGIAAYGQAPRRRANTRGIGPAWPRSTAGEVRVISVVDEAKDRFLALLSECEGGGHVSHGLVGEAQPARLTVPAARQAEQVTRSVPVGLPLADRVAAIPDGRRLVATTAAADIGFRPFGLDAQQHGR